MADLLLLIQSDAVHARQQRGDIVSAARSAIERQLHLLSELPYGSPARLGLACISRADAAKHGSDTSAS